MIVLSRCAMVISVVPVGRDSLSEDVILASVS